MNRIKNLFGRNRELSKTYITGYWQVANNRKHSWEHYSTHIPETLKRLKGQNLVLFYEDDWVMDFFLQHIPATQLHASKLKLEDLPTFGLSGKYLNACVNQDTNSMYLNLKNLGIDNPRKEKGIIHYEREYLKSGCDSYQSVFSIWTSKPFLVMQAINDRFFDSRQYVWIDAGIGKKKEWHFEDNIDTKDRIMTYGSKMLFKGEKLKRSAGVMAANKETWMKFIPLYNWQLEHSWKDNYAHDEETIISLVAEKHPNLFSSICKS